MAYQIEVIENTRDDTVSSWLNISTENNIKGWIYLGGFDPYSDSSWELIEEINNSAGHWTVRRLDQMIAAYDSQRIYSEPGRIEKNVVFIISREGIQPQINLTVIAITEEEDTIDNHTDHWLKTVDREGRIGWIFGGYTDVMRGGPKHEIPGAVIQFVLGYY